MEKHYAEALLRMIESGVEPKKAVRALFDLLKTQGRETLMPKIAHAFGILAMREARKHTVVLSVAHEKDARAAHKEVAEIARSLSVDASDIDTLVDESLIGGWRLEGKETLVDASYKKYLIEMYNRATA